MVKEDGIRDKTSEICKSCGSYRHLMAECLDESICYLKGIGSILSLLF